MPARHPMELASQGIRTNRVADLARCCRAISFVFDSGRRRMLRKKCYRHPRARPGFDLVFSLDLTRQFPEELLNNGDDICRIELLCQDLATGREWHSSPLISSAD